MKKLLTLFLTIVTTVCLVNLNNSHTKAEDPNYLKFTAVEATNVAFNVTGTLTTQPSLEYSKNNNPWSSYTLGNPVSLDVGENVRFKAASTNASFSESTDNYINFTSTGKIKASGNIMSLVDSSCASTTIPCNYCFFYLFNNCSNLISIDDLELQATTLTQNCYSGMFYKCNGLTTVPENLLPATNLVQACYSSMFSYCTSLENIPNLPAKNIPSGCYHYMFYYCTSLPKGMIESDTPSGDFTIKFTIPADGQKATGVGVYANEMFSGVSGFTASPDFSTAVKTYYKKSYTPKPAPTPDPSPKDESCEKVIGPTWHWNNEKGVCEEYATVGTSTR